MDSNCGRLAKTKSLDTFDVGQKIVIEHCYYYHDIVINSHIPTTNCLVKKYGFNCGSTQYILHYVMSNVYFNRIQGTLL